MANRLCVRCETKDSFIWRIVSNGHICDLCYSANPTNEIIKFNLLNKPNTNYEKNTEIEKTSAPAKATRKRGKKSSARGKAKTRASKPAEPIEKGRRSMFKNTPCKAPTSTATVVSSDYIFFKGKYMQVGDVVSMIDVEGGTYYAQINKFFTDEYCEKSAVVTWLLPTKASPPPEQSFDAPTYLIGPAEDLPRKLENMEFVMHLPSDYYKSDKTPYPAPYEELICKNGKF